MAIVVEATTTSPFATGSTTFTQNKPTGTVDGDFLVAFVFTGNDNGTTDLTVTTPPSGWTLARPLTHTESSGGGGFSPVNVYTYYKIASSEPASWNWTLSSSGSTLWYAGAVMRITGATEITASDDDTQNNQQSPSFTAGVTPAGSNNLMFMATIATNVSSSATTTSGYAISTSNPTWTELLDTQNDTVGSTLVASVAYATRSQSTTTGNWTLTYSTGSAMDSASQLFVITEPVSISVSIDTPGVLVLSDGGEPSFITGSNLTIDSPGILTLNGNDTTLINQENTVWTEETKNSSTVWVEDNK